MRKKRCKNRGNEETKDPGPIIKARASWGLTKGRWILGICEFKGPWDWSTD